MIDRDYAQRIIDACPVDVYLSANDGARVHWPWRMQPTHEANYRYVDHCQTFIVDSAFQREDLGNEDALTAAADLNADMAVLEDVYQDYDGTVDAVARGLELADDHEFTGDVIVPLQAPYDECYRELEGEKHYAIGGLRGGTTDERVEAAQAVRDVAGDDVWLHGLGWGATDGMVEAIRDNPDLIDAMDASTPYADAQAHEYWNGMERTTPTAIHSLAYLTEACRRMASDLSSVPCPEDLRHESQTGVGDYA
jgi:hypothetical protein